MDGDVKQHESTKFINYQEKFSNKIDRSNLNFHGQIRNTKNLFKAINKLMKQNIFKQLGKKSFNISDIYHATSQIRVLKPEDS